MKSLYSHFCPNSIVHHVLTSSHTMIGSLKRIAEWVYQFWMRLHLHFNTWTLNPNKGYNVPSDYNHVSHVIIYLVEFLASYWSRRHHMTCNIMRYHMAVMQYFSNMACWWNIAWRTLCCHGDDVLHCMHEWNMLCK